MNKYVLSKIYFLNKRNDKNVRVKVIRKTHLIDDLKAKIFLKTDIIEFKKIDIITLRN